MPVLYLRFGGRGQPSDPPKPPEEALVAAE
jgi:hypothetical protein